MSETDALARRLETLGHRVTPARLAVITAIVAQSGHFSVDDILRQTRDVGRATVFRTMRLLTDLDIVCRVLLEDGSLRYRLSRQSSHHHHLVCVSCDNVQVLDDCAVDGLGQDLAAATGYEIEGHWLEFYGRCGECRSAAAAGA